MIGTNDGQFLVYDLGTGNQTASYFVLGSEITAINSRFNRTTIGGASNHLMSWKHNDFNQKPDVISTDGFTTGLSFEQTGQEGIAATSVGTVWYIN